MKISACLISRAPSEQLDRAITSVKPLVDEIVVVFNDPKLEVAPEIAGVKTALFHGGNAQKACPTTKSCGCRKGQLLDFAALRNYSFSLASSDWLFWLDSDDELECSDPDLLRKLASQSGKNRFGFLYDYGGADIWNVRLVPQKAHPSKWEYPVHEVLITKDFGAEFEQAEGLIIRHRRTAEGQKESTLRNLRIQRHWENTARWKDDARFHFYYGQALRNLDKREEAIVHYSRCVELSGVPDEKYIAAELCSKLLIQLGKYREALSWAYRALEQWPERANGFIAVATCFYHLANDTKIYGYWICAVKYFRLSSSLVVSTSLIPTEKPEDVAFEAAILFNVALNAISEVAEALRVAEAAHKFRPDERLRLNALIYRAWLAKGKFEEAASELSSTYGQGSPFADGYVGDAVVEAAKRLPSGQSAALAAFSSLIKSIALVCGKQWNPWSPLSGAPGGSEIAIVELSKRLARKGYDVTVFASPILGGSATFDGVRWVDSLYPKEDDEFDVLVAWRGLDRIEHGKAKRRVLWMHDMDIQHSSPSRLSMVDAVVVNSHWHGELARRQVLPSQRERVYPLGAGFDPTRFDKYQGQRVVTRCLWSSSGDRGLQFVLDLWPEVRKRVPGAELAISYGLAGTKTDLPWYTTLIETIKSTEGVIYAGRRLTDQEYSDLVPSCGVWAYPATERGNWFGETWCVSACEALAAGLRVITSPIGALSEVASPSAFRQVYGHRDDEGYAERFTQAIVDAMTEPETGDRERLSVLAKDKFSWDKVADRWQERILCK